MVLLAASYLLNIMDYLFTAHWVRLYGAEIELNPIGRFLLENDLDTFIKIVGMAFLFSLLAILIKRSPRARHIPKLIFGTYALVTVYHIALFTVVY